MHHVARGQPKGEQDGKKGGLVVFPLDYFMGLGGTEYWYHLCMTTEQGEVGHGA